MAKAKVRKTRRAKMKRHMPQPARPVGVSSESTPAVLQSVVKSFAEEYQYVVADLKRIFFLAGFMLVLLAVLALVLR